MNENGMKYFVVLCKILSLPGLSLALCVLLIYILFQFKVESCISFKLEVYVMILMTVTSLLMVPFVKG